MYGHTFQGTQSGSRPVQEMEVPEAGSLLRTITLECMKSVVALTFPPDLQCLCVIHEDCSMVYLYNLQGLAVGSFDTRLSHLTGAAALRTETNVVVCSGLLSKALCVTSLVRSPHRIDVAAQKLWTLRFKPYDVRSFKADLLLILDGENSTVFIFTEKGQQLGFIRILQDPVCDGKVPYRCIGTNRGLWVAMNKRNERRVSAAVLVNQDGRVVKCYGGSEDDHRPLLYASSICEVQGGHVAILDGLTAQVHLVNKNGVFQKLLLADGTLAQPTSLVFNKSTEKPTFVVACKQKATAFQQIQFYDYNALLGEQSPVEFPDKQDVDAVVDCRYQPSTSEVQQHDGKKLHSVQRKLQPNGRGKQSDETNKQADKFAQPHIDNQDYDVNSKESVVRNQAGVTDTFLLIPKSLGKERANVRMLSWLATANRCSVEYLSSFVT